MRKQLRHSSRGRASAPQRGFQADVHKALFRCSDSSASGSSDEDNDEWQCAPQGAEAEERNGRDAQPTSCVPSAVASALSLALAAAAGSESAMPGARRPREVHPGPHAFIA